MSAGGRADLRTPARASSAHRDPGSSIQTRCCPDRLHNTLLPNAASFKGLRPCGRRSERKFPGQGSGRGASNCPPSSSRVNGRSPLLEDLPRQCATVATSLRRQPHFRQGLRSALWALAIGCSFIDRNDPCHIRQSFDRISSQACMDLPDHGAGRRSLQTWPGGTFLPGEIRCFSLNLALNLCR